MNKLAQLIDQHPNLFEAFPGKSNPKSVREALKRLPVVTPSSGLGRDHLRPIMIAKREASLSRVLDENTEGRIREVSRNAFAYAKVEASADAIRTLKDGLANVGVSIASAVLSWAYSDTYPVIDRHAWRTFEHVGGESSAAARRGSFTVDHYVRFKELIDQHVSKSRPSRSAAEIDFWMYAYSRVFLGSLNERYVHDWGQQLVRSPT